MSATQTLGLAGSQPTSDFDRRLGHVRELLRRELSAVAPGEACLTCSFQAEDVLLLHLARELQPDIPVLFLDTGYHFAETYAYRDRIAADWHLNLINLIPAAHRRRAGSRARFAAPDRSRSLLRPSQG